MEQTAHDAYLQSQVLSATPQKLRLMLIDAGIAAARQTLLHWEQNRNEDATESLIRCRDIVGELLSGVKVAESDLTRKIAAVYLFLFQALTQAQLQRTRQPVEETIRVLEVERETWRLVCEQLPHTPFPPAVPANTGREMEITSSEAAQMLDIDAPHAPRASERSSGFSLDA